MLEDGGGLFSRAGLDEGNTLATTGWFFFPDGSSVGPSAGRFIPAIPPTVCKQADNDRSGEGREGEREGEEHRETKILTRGASVEVVVVL